MLIINLQQIRGVDVECHVDADYILQITSNLSEDATAAFVTSTREPWELGLTEPPEAICINPNRCNFGDCMKLRLFSLALLSVFLALPAFAAAQGQGQTTTGNFTFTFVQQLVWANATAGGNIVCTPAQILALCNIQAVPNTAVTVTLAVSGGTAPYTWSAVKLPAGVTLGNSTGLTNTLTLAASATDPCSGTGTCLSITVTDSSIVAQMLEFKLTPQENKVAILVPPGTNFVRANNVQIPVK